MKAFGIFEIDLVYDKSSALQAIEFFFLWLENPS